MIRGTGDRKSLISLWNYQDPTTDPCSGVFESGLGEKRLRALIDHAVRKSLRKSYDKSMEKHLITALAKALHYARTKLEPRKNSSKSENFDLTNVDDDFEEEEKDQEDDGDGQSGGDEEDEEIIFDQEVTGTSSLSLSVSQTKFAEMMKSDDEESTDSRGSATGGSESENFLSLPGFDTKVPADFLGSPEPPKLSENQTGDSSEQYKDRDSEPSTSIYDEHTYDDIMSDSGVGTSLKSTSDKSLLESTPKSAKRTLTDYFSPRAKQSKLSTVIESVPTSPRSKAAESEGSRSESERTDSLNKTKSQVVKKLDFSNQEDIQPSQPVNPNNEEQSQIDNIPSSGVNSSNKDKNQEENEKTDLTEAEFLEKIKSNPSLLSILMVQSSRNFNRKNSSKSSPDEFLQLLKFISIDFTIAIETQESVLNQQLKVRARLDQIQKAPSTPDGTILVIFLPFIRDIDDKPIKQPMLFKVKESQFLEFGFDIPFSDYFDEFKNLFEIQIQRNILQGQIIATGESNSELKKCFANCLKLNQEWKDCRKMIGNSGILRQLKFKPIQKTSDLSFHKVMSLEDLENFLGSAESNQETENDEIMEQSSTFQEQMTFPGTQNHLEEDIYPETNIEEKPAKPFGEKDISKPTCHCSDQLKSKKVIFETIEKKLGVLIERQKLISQLDLHGSILFELIDVVSEIRSLVIEKDSEDQSSMMRIAKQDNTYKIKKKNRIFIEGLVEFELDKYEHALKKAKKRNPFSFAYQFVKNCFPESYFRNVTLGKKYYNESEMAEYSEQKRLKGKEKFPLAFIWGFANPFDEPFKGEFDLNRGQERVRALIEHILRKSDVLEYNEDLENKIRQRLVKELCSRNKPHGKNTDSGDIDENEEDSNDNTESGLSDVWDNNCFE
uniref:Uncharacterized protein n=1 Tax=Tetranychus urticae TaxID=32264 RepID=T1L4P7_TETUR